MTNWISSFFSGHYLLIIAQTIIALLALVHILLNKTRPSTMLGWAGVVILAPIFGALFYYVFGISRVKRRAVKLQDITTASTGARLDETPVVKLLSPQQPALPLSLLSGGQLTPYSAHCCNEIQAYNSPDNAYQAMLAAIENAQYKISLTTYIFDVDTVGLAFIAALSKAKQRGVKVQVIIDGIGALNQWPKLQSISWQLLHSHIDFQQFIPPKLLPPSFSINLRNHRKLLILDESTVYTGGLNISQRHSESHFSKKRGRWSQIKGFPASVDDLHFKFEGEVARDCQHIFDSDWAFIAGEEAPKLPAKEISQSKPASDPLNQRWVRAISDGPSDAWNRFSALFHSQISRAENKIAIVTPYFIPTSSMLDSIQTATLHGVDVSIYLPRNLDQKIMQWARMHIIKEAMDSGANIFFRDGDFSHTKLFLVDENYCFLGSPNWDPRSLLLNFESGIECHDPELSTTLWRHVAGIRDQSLLYTAAMYKAIPLAKRIRNSIAWMGSPYL